MSTVKNQRFYFIPVGEESNENYQSLLDQSLEYVSGTTKFLGAVTAISTLNISSNSVMMGGVTALSSFNVSGTTSLMGKVGVGTNNPVAPLQVTANGATNVSSGPALNGLYVFNPTNTANQDAVVCIRTGGSSAGNPYLSLDINNEVGWSVGVDNADSNKFKIGSSWDFNTTNTKFTIDTSGNVGIGTTVPEGNLLKVDGGNTVSGISLGNFNVTAAKYIGITPPTGMPTNISVNSGFSGITFGGPYAGDNSSGYLAFHSHSLGQTSGERMRLDKNGNFGIGTTTPGALLHVSGTSLFGGAMTASSTLNIAGNLNVSDLRMTGITTGPAGLNSESSNIFNMNLNFRPIGSYTQANVGAAFRIDGRDDNANSNPVFQWLYRQAGTTTEKALMILNNSGTLALGTGYASPSSILHVSGNTTILGNTTLGSRLNVSGTSLFNGAVTTSSTLSVRGEMSVLDNSTTYTFSTADPGTSTLTTYAGGGGAGGILVRMGGTILNPTNPSSNGGSGFGAGGSGTNAVKARYIRFEFGESYGGNPRMINLSGVKVYSSFGGVNIINSTMVTSASDILGSSGPEYMVDNDDNTIFHSDVNGEYPWVQVDLGAETFIHRVELTNRIPNFDGCSGRLGGLVLKLKDNSNTITYTSNLLPLTNSSTVYINGGGGYYYYTFWPAVNTNVYPSNSLPYSPVPYTGGTGANGFAYINVEGTEYFTQTSGSYNIPTSGIAKIIVMGGGGGGGTAHNAGGGAGYFETISTTISSGATATITVGNGGNSATNGTLSSVVINDGTTTYSTPPDTYISSDPSNRTTLVTNKSVLENIYDNALTATVTMGGFAISSAQTATYLLGTRTAITNNQFSVTYRINDDGLTKCATVTFRKNGNLIDIYRSDSYYYTTNVTTYNGSFINNYASGSSGYNVTYISIVYNNTTTITANGGINGTINVNGGAGSSSGGSGNEIYALYWRPNLYPAQYTNSNSTFLLDTSATSPAANIITSSNPHAYTLSAGTYSYYVPSYSNDSNDYVVLTLVNNDTNAVIATIVNNNVAPWNTVGPFTGSFTLASQTNISVRLSNGFYQYGIRLNIMISKSGNNASNGGSGGSATNANTTSQGTTAFNNMTTFVQGSGVALKVTQSGITAVSILVSGAVTANSTLNVVGNTTMANSTTALSTFNVSGTSTFNNTITATSSMNISGSTNIKSTLNVMNAVSANSTMNISGTTSIMGNLGIGTTNPIATRKVTIQGSGGTSNMIAFNKSDNPVPYVGVGYDQTNDGFAIMTNNGTTDLNTTSMFISRTVNANVGINTVTPSENLHVVGTGLISSSFKVNGAMTATSTLNVSGNTVIMGTVGIGTVPSSSMLHVNGGVIRLGTLYEQLNMNFPEQIQWGSLGIGYANITAGFNNNGGPFGCGGILNLTSRLGNSSNYNGIFINNGKVGVGISSPTTMFHVTGSSLLQGAASVTSTLNVAGALVAASSISVGSTLNATGGINSFSDLNITGNTTINNVGSDTWQSSLSIKNNSSNASYGFLVGGSGNSSSFAGVGGFAIYNNTSEFVFNINNNGNVGINNTNPSAKLHVSGTMIAGGATTNISTLFVSGTTILNNAVTASSSINVLGDLRVNTIRPYVDTITGPSATNETINIIGHYINIGDSNSVINIQGTTTSVFTNEIIVEDPLIVVNSKNSGVYNTSGNDSGIQIDAISSVGYIKTTADATKFAIKAPQSSDIGYIVTKDNSDNLTITGTTYMKSAITGLSTLNVSGNTVVGGTLNVSGNSGIIGTLAVGTSSARGSYTADIVGTATYPLSGATTQLVVSDSVNPLMNLLLGSNGTNNYASIQASLSGTGWMPLTLNPSGGNVGIGITNASSLLQLNADYSLSGLYEAGELSFGTKNVTPSYWRLGAITGYIAAGANNDNSQFPGGLMFKTKAANGTANNTLINRMVLDSRGYLGVGTLAPSTMLHVSGSTILDGAVTMTNTLNISGNTVIQGTFTVNGNPPVSFKQLASAPANPNLGDEWYNTSTSVLYKYINNYWVTTPVAVASNTSGTYQNFVGDEPVVNKYGWTGYTATWTAPSNITLTGLTIQASGAINNGGSVKLQVFLNGVTIIDIWYNSTTFQNNVIDISGWSTKTLQAGQTLVVNWLVLESWRYYQARNISELPIIVTYTSLSNTGYINLFGLNVTGNTMLMDATTVVSRLNVSGATTFANTITLAAHSASTVLVTDANKNLVSSSISTTTLSYLDATSSIQAQLNNITGGGITLAGDQTMTGIKTFQSTDKSRQNIILNGVALGDTTDNTNGMGLQLHYSALGNRQLVLTDSAVPYNGTSYSIMRFGVGMHVGDPFIDAVSNDGNTTAKKLLLGNNSGVYTNGSLGVGTNPSATYKLDVSGDIRSSGAIVIGNGGVVEPGIIYSDVNWGMLLRAKRASPSVAEFLFTNASDTHRMVINNSGYVGIGTDTPTTTLELKSTGSPNLRISNPTGTNNYIDFGTDDTGRHWAGFGYGNYPMVWGTNGTERMRLSAGGYLGIGTNAPVSLLSLNNRINFEAGTTSDGGNAGWHAINFNGYHNSGEYFVNTSKYRWRMVVDQRSTEDYFMINMTNSSGAGGTPFYINTSGNIGMSTNTPQSTLHVNGTSIMGGAMTATSTLNVSGNTLILGAMTANSTLNVNGTMSLLNSSPTYTFSAGNGGAGGSGGYPGGGGGGGIVVRQNGSVINPTTTATKGESPNGGVGGDGGIGFGAGGGGGGYWAGVTAVSGGVGANGFVYININNTEYFTQTSGNYTIPSSGSAKIIMIGGGGSGGNNATTNNLGSGGGGAGYIQTYTVSVTSGQTATITVGSGGTAPTQGTANNGGNTSVVIGASTYSANGGMTGTSNQYGGAGSSSGGSGGLNNSGMSAGGSGGTAANVNTTSQGTAVFNAMITFVQGSTTFYATTSGITASSIFVSGALTANSTFNVGGSTTIVGNTTVLSTLNVSGNTVFNNPTTAMSSMNISGATLINSTLNVNNTTYIGGAMTAASTMNILNNVSIGNSGTPNVPLLVQGNAGSSRVQVQGTDATNATWRLATPSAGTIAFGGNSNHSVQFGYFAPDNSSFTPNLTIQGNTRNVGIGTATPESVLNIVGSSSGSNGGGAGSIVQIKQNTGWSGAQPWALYVEGYSYLNGFRINAADEQRALYKTTEGGAMGFATYGATPITFTISDTDERMRINSNGNIGIGTSAPNTTLHVNGTSTLQGASTVTSTLFVGGAATTNSTLNVGGILTTASNANISGHVSISTTLNVASTSNLTGNTVIGGCGVNNFPLNVGGSGEQYTMGSSAKNQYFNAGTMMAITPNYGAGGSGAPSSNNATLIDIGNYNTTDGNTNAYFGAISGTEGNLSSNLVFGRRSAVLGWTETMRIDTIGRVGIATTSPSDTLHVSGTTRINGNMTALSNLNISGTTSIGTSSSAFKLNVAGSINATNYQQFNWNSGVLLGPNNSMYNNTTPSYFKIATLGSTGDSTNGGSLTIRGSMGQWVEHPAYVDISIKTRGGLAVQGKVMTPNLDVQLDFNGYAIDMAIYNESDGTYSVYLKMRRYISFDLMIGGNSSLLVTPLDPATTSLITSPTGTMTMDSVLTNIQYYFVNGMIGVGTKNPTGKLDLVGTSSMSSLVLRKSTNPTSGYYGYMGLATASNDGITGSASGDVVFRNDDSGGFIFGYGNAPSVKIANTGYMGIGTTNPSTNLHVSGTTILGGAVTTNSTLNVLGAMVTNGTVSMNSSLNVSGQTTIYGKTGIGLTPSYMLDVQTTEQHIARFRNTAEYSRVLLDGMTGTDLIFQTNGVSKYGIATIDGKLQFLLNDSISTRPLTLDTNGNIGVGTQSPSTIFHVSGTTTLEGPVTTTSSFNVAGAALINGYLGIGSVPMHTTSTKLFISGPRLGAIPQQFVISDSANWNQQLIIGTHSASGTSVLQSLLQGSVFNSLLLNPNGGNVGVATFNPTVQMDINGTTIVRGAMTTSSTLNVAGAMTVVGAMTTNSTLNVAGNLTTTGTMSVTKPTADAVMNFTDTTTNTSWMGQVYTTDNWITGSVAGDMFLRPAKSLFLGVNNQTNAAMKINTSGQVGIGTNNPTALLHVSGTSIMAGATTANSTFNVVGAMNAASTFVASGAVSMNSSLNVSGTTTIMGRLGINITNPSDIVDIRLVNNGTSFTISAPNNGGNGSQPLIKFVRYNGSGVVSTSSYIASGGYDDGGFTFGTSQTDTGITMQQNGRVGIGMWTPSALLHVSGTSIITGAMTTGSTLNVNGGLVASSTFVSAGAISGNSTMLIAGAMTGTSSLNISGTTVLQGAVSVGSTLNIRSTGSAIPTQLSISDSANTNQQLVLGTYAASGYSMIGSILQGNNWNNLILGPGGNVGIANFAPEARLDVSGTSIIRGATTLLSNLNVSGNTVIQGTFTVNGNPPVSFKQLASAPANPNLGDEWYNTSTSVLYKYVGNNWVVDPIAVASNVSTTYQNFTGSESIVNKYDQIFVTWTAPTNLTITSLTIQASGALNNGGFIVANISLNGVQVMGQAYTITSVQDNVINISSWSTKSLLAGQTLSIQWTTLEGGRYFQQRDISDLPIIVTYTSLSNTGYINLFGLNVTGNTMLMDATTVVSRLNVSGATTFANSVTATSSMNIGGALVAASTALISGAITATSTMNVSGNSILMGMVGINNITPSAMLDIQSGGDNDGTSDMKAIAFSYRLGGFRHWLRTRHNGNAGGAGNSLDFYVNNSNTPSGSSAPGTGSIHTLTMDSGKVGVGTMAPTTSLHVSGTTLLTGSTTTNSTLFVGGAVTTNSTMNIAGNTFVLGNMGVGTSNTISRLTVSVPDAGSNIGQGSWDNKYLLVTNDTTGSGAAGGMGFSYSATKGGVISAAVPGSIFTNINYIADAHFMSVGGSNTQVLTLASSGNVGIGTTGPSKLLHVAGTALITGAVTSNSTLFVGGAMTANSTLNISGAATANSTLNVVGNLNASELRMSGIALGPAGFNTENNINVLNMNLNFRPSGSIIQSNMGAAFRIDGRNDDVGISPLFQWLYRPANSSSETAFMNLNSSGNLALGTWLYATFPSMLYVSGTSIFNSAVTASSSLVISGATTANSTMNVVGNSTVQGNMSVTGNSTLMGSVGIGTQSATSKLQIHSGLPNGQTGLWEGPDISLKFDDYAGGQWNMGRIAGYIAAGANNSTANWPGGLLFQTKPATTMAAASVTRMVIDSQGFVGIGTTAPQTMLHVSGNSLLTGSMTAGSTMYVGGAMTTNSTLNVVGALTTNAITALSSVNISGMTTINSTLNVSGALVASSSISVGSILNSTGGINSFSDVNITGHTTINNPSSDNWQTNLQINNNSSVASYQLLVGGSGNNSSAAGVGGLAIHGGLSGTTGFRLNINSNGNVGIGNTNPSAKLQVSGTMIADGATTIGTTLSVSGTTILNSAVTMGSTLNVVGDVRVNTIRPHVDTITGPSVANETVNILGHYINIGSPESVINIQGTTTSVFTNEIIVEDPLLVINSKNSGQYNVNGNDSGIQIDAISSVGYLKTTSDGMKFAVKAPMSDDIGYMVTKDNNDNLTITGTTIMKSGISGLSTLNISGMATLNNLITSGAMTANSTLNVNGGLIASGGMSSNTTLNVSGMATLNNLVTSGAMTANSTLNVVGVLTAAGGLSSAATTVTSSINVSGMANLNNLITSGASTNTSSLNVAGVLTADGGLVSSSTAALSSATISSTLNVSGMATLNNLITSGPMTTNSTLNVVGMLTAAGGLSSSATTVTSTLNVSGMANLNNLISSGATTNTSSLNVAGVLTAAGGLVSSSTADLSSATISSTLNVSGNSILQGKVSVGSTLLINSAGGLQPAQIIVTDSNNPNQQLLLGTNATSGYSMIGSILQGTGWNNLIMNPVSGNVGIGNYTADAKLDVNGTSIIRGAMTNSSTLNVVGGLVANSTASLSSATIVSTLNVIGNVGIGTASTSNALEVAQSGTVKLGNALYTQLRTISGTNYLPLSSYVANLSINNLTQSGPSNGIYTYTVNSNNYAWIVSSNNPVPANTTLYYIITISSNSNSFIEIKGSNNGVARIYNSQVSSNINNPSVLTLGPYTTAGYVGNVTFGIFSNGSFGVPSAGSSFNLHSIVVSETIPSSYTDTILNGNVGIGISNPSTLLHVSGSTSLQGATTLASTLNVSGATSLQGATTVLSTFNVSGVTALQGATTLASTIFVSGAATANSTMNIAGNTTINGNLSVNNPITITNPNSGWTSSLAIFQPNVTNGNGDTISFGKASSTKNSIQLQYYHVADGSDNNQGALQMNGVGSIITWKANRMVGINTGSPSAGFHVNGTTILEGAVTTTSTVVISGAATANSTMNVAGAFVAASTALVSGAATANSTMNVAGALVAASTALVSGAMTANSTLNVSGNLNASEIRMKDISMGPSGLNTENGDILNMNLNFRPYGDVTQANYGGAFRIDGRNNLYDNAPLFQWLYRPAGSASEYALMNLNNSGNLALGTSINGTAPSMLYVSGTTILNSALTTNSTLNISGAMLANSTARIGGAMTASSTLNVVGAVVAGSTASISGAMTASSTMNIGGNTTVIGDLNVGTTSANGIIQAFNKSTTSSRFHLTLTGSEFYQPAEWTSTDGIGLSVGVNRVNNRQLWIADTSLAVNTTNTSFRIIPNSGTIDVISTDGTMGKTLNLGNATGGITLTQTTATSTLNVVGAINGSSSLNVTGAITTASTMNVGTSMVVGSTANIIGAVSANSTMNVSGNTVVMGTMAVGRSSARSSYTVDIVGAPAYPLVGAATQVAISDIGNSGNMNLLLGTNATNNYGSIQASLSGTGAMPLTLNPSGGNVGIGMTNPSALLHVNGTSIVGGAITAASTLNVAGAMVAASAVTVNSTLRVSGTTTLMNNVGINNTNPTYKLDILGGGCSQLITSNDATFTSAYAGYYSYSQVGRLFIGIDGPGLAEYATNSGIMGTWSNHHLLFATNATERIRILNSGNMGIGTITPGALLHVSGTSIMTGASTHGSTLNIAGAMVAASTALVSGAMTANSTMNVTGAMTANSTMNISGNTLIMGNLGVGTTPTSSVFHANGGVVRLGTIYEQLNTYFPEQIQWSTITGGAGGYSNITAGINGIGGPFGCGGILNLTTRLGNSQSYNGIFINDGKVGVGISSPTTMFHVTGSSLLQGAASVTSTLNVAGALVASSTALISGAMTANSTMNISGAMVAASTVNISGAISAGSTLVVSGATTALSTMNVNGNTVVMGNLGVGVSGSAYKLHVTSGLASAATSFPIRIGGSAFANNGNNTGTFIGLGTEDASWSKCAIGHVRTAGYDVGDIVFLTNNSVSDSNVTMSDERMRLNSSGNLGIGTNAPGAMLHVSGTTIIGGAMTASSTLNISGVVTMNTTANISGNTSIMGTLGVGIASPLNKLDVRGTGPTAISIGDLSAIRGTIGYVDSNGNYSTNGVVGDMVFRNEDNTKKLHLQAGTGNAVVTISNTSMGIGNINPSANLHVSGTTILSGATTTASTLNIGGAMVAASTVNATGAMTATSTLNVSGTTTLSNKVVLGPSSSTPSNNSTISTSKSVHFANPNNNIDSVILEAGTNDGQMFILVNRSEYDIMFHTTDATANVAMSNSTMVYGKSSVMFIWSATDTIWYPSRDTF